MFLNVYSENRCLLWWLRGLPQMQGIQVDPGTSQFRRLWATSTEKMMSTNMTRPDLSHSCRLERSRPNPAPKGAPPHGIREIGPIFLAQGPDHEMSAMGQKRKEEAAFHTSVLPLEADYPVLCTGIDVLAEIRQDCLRQCRLCESGFPRSHLRVFRRVLASESRNRG